MNSFQIASLPTEIADAVRVTGKAPQYGFPAHKEVASGRAPCRHCLRLIRANEEQLFLFTYDPFEPWARLRCRVRCTYTLTIASAPLAPPRSPRSILDAR
jgi:hypothetical protein